MNILYLPGKYPKLSVFLSLILTGTLVGISYFFRPGVVLSFDEGYTRKDAPSIKELQAQIDFFGNQGTPWYMALFAEPRSPSGSMVESPEFYEFKRFYFRMKNNMTIRTELLDVTENTRRDLTYMDYCGTMCNFNNVVFQTFSMAWLGLDWPVTSIMDYQSNIGKYFFKREMEGSQINSAGVAALYFMVFINSTEMKADLTEFERLVAEEVAAHNANDENKVILTQHGARGMEMEIKRGMEMTSSVLLLGFLAFVIVTLLSLVIINRVNKRCTGWVIPLGAFALLVPIFSLLCVLGVFGLLGWHINTLTFLSPIFVFPYTILNLLQVYNSWLIQSNLRKDTDYTAFKEAFKQGNYCVHYNVASFVVLLIPGLFYPIPELGTFLKFIGVTVFFVHFHLLYFLAPFFYVCSPIPTHKKLESTGNGTCSQQCNSQGWKTYIDDFVNRVSNNRVTFFALSGLYLMTLMSACAVGIPKIHGNLDYRQLLPPDSPSNKGVQFMSDVVWPDFLHILFIFESPPDFSDPYEYNQFKNFISEAEKIPGAMGRNADMVWLYDFQRFINSPANAIALDMSKFRSFITHDVYNAWNSGVQYVFEGDKAIITRMIYMVGINGTTTMADKARLMSHCREITNRYPQFSVVPFDTEVGMVDVIAQVPTTSIWIPLFIIITQGLSLSFSTRGFRWLPEVLMFQVLPFAASLLIPAIFGLRLNPFAVAFSVFLAILSSSLLKFMIAYFVTADPEECRKNKAKSTLTHTLLPSILSVVLCTVILIPIIFCKIAIFVNLAIMSVVFTLTALFIIVFVMPVYIVASPGGDP